MRDQPGFSPPKARIPVNRILIWQTGVQQPSFFASAPCLKNPDEGLAGTQTARCAQQIATPISDNQIRKDVAAESFTQFGFHVSQDPDRHQLAFEEPYNCRVGQDQFFLTIREESGSAAAAVNAEDETAQLLVGCLFSAFATCAPMDSLRGGRGFRQRNDYGECEEERCHHF